MQRPKSWSAARAAPVRLKVAEGITAAARAPAFAPHGRLCAAAREALDAGLGRTAGRPACRPPSLAPTLWPQPRRIGSVGVGASLRPHSSCPPLEGDKKRIFSWSQTWTFTRVCHYTSTGGESWLFRALPAFHESIFFRNPDGNAAPRETPGNERAPPLRLGRLPGLAGLSPARLQDIGVGKRRGK